MESSIQDLQHEPENEPIQSPPPVKTRNKKKANRKMNVVSKHEFETTMNFIFF